jgi:hypothetical protein
MRAGSLSINDVQTRVQSSLTPGLRFEQCQGKESVFEDQIRLLNLQGEKSQGMILSTMVDG